MGVKAEAGDGVVEKVAVGLDVAVLVGGGVGDSVGSVLIIGGDIVIDSVGNITIGNTVSITVMVGMSLDAGVQETKTIARMTINGILVIIAIAIILSGTAQWFYARAAPFRVTGYAHVWTVIVRLIIPIIIILIFIL